MKRFSRRSFLKRTSLAVGAATALAPHAKVLGANDDLRVATEHSENADKLAATCETLRLQLKRVGGEWKLHEIGSLVDPAPGGSFT